jgi:peptidyl-prolyl cis-trans isomerase D
MLQDIRNNSQGTVAKIIVGVIVVVFALFGAESIVGGLSGEPEVATVNGEGITERNFLRAVEGKRRQILAQMGERADPDLIEESLLKSSVLEGLINEKILVLDAEGKDLYISDEAVENYIRNIDQFKVDGKFSNERMQMILRNAALTLKSYKESLKSQFVIDQARSGLIASAFVVGNERDEIVALDRQTRDFGLATVFKSDYIESIAVSDEDVATYYEEHKDAYKKARNVDVSYLTIDRASLAESIEVDEERIMVMYETEKAEFVGEEERTAAHILIKIDDDTTEVQALDKIKAVEARLLAGEAFDSLAKELSEDEGSASAGGDLGRSGKGVYVADFENALFALAAGEVSAPVKTEFGYHLIKLESIETNEIPAFEEMRAGLEERYRKEEADQLYAELAENVADITYSSPDLAEAADELSLEVRQLAGVSSDTVNEIFASPRVQKVLFSDELVTEQNNSELIEFAEGRSVVFRVDALHEPSILPLESVKEQVRDEIKVSKSAEFAASVGEAYRSRIAAGEDAVAVAQEMGVNWKQHNGVRRDDVMLNREVVTKLFTLAKQEQFADNIVGFEIMDGDYAVIVLNEVHQGSAESATSMELFSISNMLGSSIGAVDYRNYQEMAVSAAEIEKF